MNKRVIPPFVLRSYQSKDIARLKEAFASHRAVILAAETGSGKTHEAGTLIREWLLRGWRALPASAIVAR